LVKLLSGVRKNMAPLKKINEAAKLWEKTKDPKYKKLWYKLIEEYVNGLNNPKRRAVSIDSCVKNNDGTYIFIGRSKLL
jgi:hypothetical protein